MMYTALIVDDERIIRNGILKMPLWKDLDIEVQAAANGVEAMELLSRQSFDILITDIRMPGVNGLSLIEAAIKKYPNMQIAVLSGHTQFEYTQAALRFGVQDYLLKPISPQEFRQMVEKMLENISRHKQLMEKASCQQEEMLEISRRSEEACVAHMLMGMPYSAQFLPKWMQSDCLSELFLIVPPWSDPEREVENVPLILREIKAKLEENPLIGKNLNIVPLLGNVAVVSESNPQLVSCTMECLNRLVLSENLQEDADFLPAAVCRVGPLPANQLPEMYRKANEMAGYRFYWHKTVLLSSSAISETPCSFPQGVLETVEKREIANARAQLKDFYQQTRKLEPKPESTRKICLALYNELMAQLDEKEQRLGKRISELLILDQRLNFSALYRMLDQLMLHIELAWAEEKLKSYSEPVRKAILYTKKEFADESLSLGKLASEVLFVNADYFGRMFRRETGLNFAQYLLNLRMKEAQRMIETCPEMRITQVCEQVGYGVKTSYFSQTFRNYTGCTPSEYKHKVETSTRQDPLLREDFQKKM